MSKETLGNIFFFAIVCLVVLWQMFWPGYILTLDMVFAPHLNFNAWFSEGNFLNSSPLIYLLKFLNLFLAGWVIQKILILGLFFLIGYLAYLYLPVPKKNYARYFAALVYLINPFVYERFLAGQITVLFAYAFLPPFIAALIRFHRQPLWKSVFKLFGWLILINIFSLHLFVMSVLVLAGYFAVSFFLRQTTPKPLPSTNSGQALEKEGDLTHPVSSGTSHPSREGNFNPPRLANTPRPRGAATPLDRGDFGTPPGEGNLTHPGSAAEPPLLIEGTFTRQWDWAIKFLVGGLVFLAISSYWLVPYFLNQDSSVINNFDQSNWQAFKTAGDKHLGTAVNVLSLYGFWEEHENWAGYFIWPKDNYVFWLIATLALLILIISGIIWGVKEKRKLAIALTLIGLGSFIFSCGAGDTIFKNLNWWLFEHFSFWRGFRDSEKWTSYLVLVYAIFGGWGVSCLSEFWQKKRIEKYFVYLLMTLAILGTYTELGGFARQLQPVWYPESWYKAKQILDQDKEDYRILFLPWHAYLSLNFNHKLITANPADQFFGGKIIQSRNMEMPGASGNYIDRKYIALDKMITDDNLSAEMMLDVLQENKIKYIISLPDLIGADKYQYNFINQGKIKPILEENDLKLFTVSAK
ncbi:MAG: hypothetical protein PHE24_05725 [Patescibacteria group bacterium]|nr:hypothetical protein [Patescibacteria group bacterium]